MFVITEGVGEMEQQIVFGRFMRTHEFHVKMANRSDELKMWEFLVAEHRRTWMSLNGISLMSDYE
jgi:hypothetical protein